MEYRKRSKSNPLDELEDSELGITEYDNLFELPIKKQNIFKRFFGWIYIKLTAGYMRRYRQTNNLSK
jgi:hypothetical protein